MLLIIALILVRMPTVQTWMAQKVATHLSKELNTKVSIDYLSIEFFTKLNLKGFYIEDQKNDTLIYAGELKVNSRMFSPFKFQVNLKSLELENAYVNLKKYEGDENLNIEFLINYFATGDTTSTSEPWKIKTGSLKINNSIFSYSNLNSERTGKGFNSEYLKVYNF
ncbi:MAG: hypothetical protein ACR2GN_02440, partial [Bacteroidia bacterium]